MAKVQGPKTLEGKVADDRPHLLIIDDEDRYLKEQKKEFEARGFKVTAWYAADPEAFKEVNDKRMKAAGASKQFYNAEDFAHVLMKNRKQFDAVLTDLVLIYPGPEGEAPYKRFDGFDATEMLHAKWPKLPIFLHTMDYMRHTPSEFGAAIKAYKDVGGRDIFFKNEHDAIAAAIHASVREQGKGQAR